VIKLVWIAMLFHAQGVIPIGALTDETTFQTREQCEAFGKETAPRMSDFVRGVHNLPWRADVQIRFRCEPNGEPA
jgi:hypothetical protein